MYSLPLDPKELTRYQVEELHKTALEELLDSVSSTDKLSAIAGIAPDSIRMWQHCGRISRQGAVAVLTHPELRLLSCARYLRVDLTRGDIARVNHLTARLGSEK